ncbi:hypothetical protein GGH99_005777, partial [Coemansia sp. RSA 1285]
MATYISDDDDSSGIIAVADDEPVDSTLSVRHMALCKELKSVEAEISALEHRRRGILKDIDDVKVMIEESAQVSQTRHNEHLKVGYESSNFAWSFRINELRNQVFRIGSFRGNQKAIINATLDGRDVV